MQEDASSQQEKRIKQRDMVAPRPEVGTETKARAIVLLLKANPQGAMSAQEGLRIEQEINQIKTVLRENRDVVDLREEGAVRMRDLSPHLLRHQPVLLHFSGHGTEEGELVLEKYGPLDELRFGTHLSTGLAGADYIEYAVIARILAEYRATLSCVVLSTSNTEPLAEAICAAEIPCAIGMRGPINDRLAIRFSEIFYRSLTIGESVGLAFRKARSDVLSNRNARAETFQLKSGSGVNPDEIYIVPGRRRPVMTEALGDEEDEPEQAEVDRMKKRLDEQQNQLEATSSQQQKKITHYVELGKQGTSLMKIGYNDLLQINKLFVQPEGYQEFERQVWAYTGNHILVIAGQEHSGKLMTALYMAQQLWLDKHPDFYLFVGRNRTLHEIISDGKLPSNAVILFDEVFDKGQIRIDDLTSPLVHLNEDLANLTNVWFIFTVVNGPILDALQARNFPILFTTGVNCQQVLEKLIDFFFPEEFPFGNVRAELLATKAKLDPRLTPSDLRQLFDTKMNDPKALIDALTKKEGKISNTKAVKTFYCYARKDESLRDELGKHLAPLERSGQIITWYDRKILPGTEWKNEISNRLDTSDIILLLVSSSFMQSDYCYSIEMQRALERHRAGAVRVIPIILRPCDWKATPIHALQALPENGRPISKWRNRDDAFQDVVKGIRQVINTFYSTPSRIQKSAREAEYKEMILCPYCLVMQELQQDYQCNNLHCGREVPPKYVESARHGNLTCLGTFGLPQQGKTAFLASLMESVQGVVKIVPSSYVSPINDETMDTLNEWRARFSSGTVNMPSTAPNERPKPLLLMNHKFCTKNKSILVAYDLAGEALVRARSQPEYARALSKVNTLWCVVSLYDLINKNEEGYDLAGLFTTYLEAMTSLQIPIMGKNILVVYTKADLLVGMPEGLQPLPPEVINYLGTDPYSQIRTKRSTELPPFDEDAYFAKMCAISDILRDYTIDFVPGGGAFVNMVGEEDANIFFTINSAFGGSLDAENTRAGFAVQGYRVLDALIWAIKLNRTSVPMEQVALIVHPR